MADRMKFLFNSNGSFFYSMSKKEIITVRITTIYVQCALYNKCAWDEIEKESKKVEKR